jgi:glucose/arabinose dehydrogenase
LKNIEKMKENKYLFIITIALLIIPVLLFAQEDAYPPGTIQMTPKVDLNLEPVPLIVPEKFQGMVPEGLTMNLPPGFSVKVFAVTGLRGPRMMAFNNDGVLHVANMKAGIADEFQPHANDFTSQIVALPDRDNDGVADTVIIAADSLRWANSLVFYKGDMYVADTHQIVKFTDADGDLVYEKREVFADNIPTANTPHITRTIVVDEAKELFYLSVGSHCDVCRETDPERAAVLQFNADGTGRRVFATGLRNAVGLDIHPLTGELWATNNGHTEAVDSLPPEWIGIVRDGGFYGWPLAYGYQVYINFEIRGHPQVLPITHEDSLLVETMERPAALVDAHSAPMDIYFYPSGNFPNEYLNTAFVAYRAGFLGPDPGHKVVALFVDPDGSNAKVGDFMTGFWPNPPDQSNIWGKPVGLTSDSVGNLYISSDWINNLILRVEYHGGQTGVIEKGSALLPLSATLEQNYPNPFNPITTIRYTIRHTGTATITFTQLKVYDVLGREIALLVNEEKPAGNYEVKFDGSDLPSGIYYYRLSVSAWTNQDGQVGNFSNTKKLVLLK